MKRTMLEKSIFGLRRRSTANLSSSPSHESLSANCGKKSGLWSESMEPRFEMHWSFSCKFREVAPDMFWSCSCLFPEEDLCQKIVY